MQVLWATRDDMADLYGDVLALWRDWADDLRGGPVESGHHIAEESPENSSARSSASGAPTGRQPA